MLLAYVVCALPGVMCSSTTQQASRGRHTLLKQLHRAVVRRAAPLYPPDFKTPFPLTPVQKSRAYLFAWLGGSTAQCLCDRLDSVCIKRPRYPACACLGSCFLYSSVPPTESFSLNRTLLSPL